jgi:hypothetical protein
VKVVPMPSDRRGYSRVLFAICAQSLILEDQQDIRAIGLK